MPHHRENASRTGKLRNSGSKSEFCVWLKPKRGRSRKTNPSYATSSCSSDRLVWKVFDDWKRNTRLWPDRYARKFRKVCTNLCTNLVSLAKIQDAFEMKNIWSGPQHCYMTQINGPSGANGAKPINATGTCRIERLPFAQRVTHQKLCTCEAQMS